MVPLKCLVFTCPEMNIEPLLARFQARQSVSSLLTICLTGIENCAKYRGKIRMLCHERVHTFFYKWVRALISAVGQDIFRKDLRPGPLTYFVYVMFAMFFLSCFYTIATRQLLSALAGIAYLCLAWEVSN